MSIQVLNIYSFKLGENPNKESILTEIKQALSQAKESFLSFLTYAFKIELR